MAEGSTAGVRVLRGGAPNQCSFGWRPTLSSLSSPRVHARHLSGRRVHRVKVGVGLLITGLRRIKHIYKTQEFSWFFLIAHGN